MWEVHVPLGEFYDAVATAGCKANYLALITALVREADSTSFYDDISRYWNSLHDLTGPDFLFVLAGRDASAKVGSHGVPDGREPIAYCSPAAAVVSSWERQLLPELSYWARPGTLDAPPSAELANSQTLSVNQLRRRLEIPESRLPCLHVEFIAYERRKHAVTIPVSTRTVYGLVKDLVSRFDEKFKIIRELASRSEHLNRSKRSNLRTFVHPLEGFDGSAEQLEAARAIVAICAAPPSSPREIAVARRKCFELFAVVKGTSGSQSDQIRSLQRHIDIHLHNKAGTTSREPKMDDAESALEAAWEDIFSRASELANVSPASEEKYRIFVGYGSNDRWIAEYLHTALARHTSTFLDVRCLRPGDRWVERIRSAQDNAEITVLLVGDSGATSWFHQAEYLRAIELVRANKQRLVPVYIKGSPGSPPYGLEGLHGIVTTWALGLREDEVRKTAMEIAGLLAKP